MGGTSQQAGEGFRWTLEMRPQLRNAKGDLTKEITRRADGANIGLVTRLITSIDGSLCAEAMQASSGGMMAPMGPDTVSIFDPDAKPVRNFPLMQGFSDVVGFDGKRILVRQNDMSAMDLNGKVLWRADLSFIPNSMRWSVTKDCRYLVTVTPREVKFYSLPSGT